MKNAEPPPPSLRSGAQGTAAAVREDAQVVPGEASVERPPANSRHLLASHESECETVKISVLVSAPIPSRGILKPLESPNGREH